MARVDTQKNSSNNADCRSPRAGKIGEALEENILARRRSRSCRCTNALVPSGAPSTALGGLRARSKPRPTRQWQRSGPAAVPRGSAVPLLLRSRHGSCPG